MDCTTCTKYAGKLIDKNGLCRLKGPLSELKCCNKYIEQINDVIILNGKFCYRCIHFKYVKLNECFDFKNHLFIKGLCQKYKLDIYDGYTRKACSNYEQPS